MYNAIDSSFQETIKKGGFIRIAIADRFSGYSMGQGACFVPHIATYISVTPRGDDNQPINLELARFYITHERDIVHFERINLTDTLEKKEKAIQNMFLVLLIEEMITWAKNNRMKALSIEGKHPDLAEYLSDQKFEIISDRGSYKGKRNVQNSDKKAKLSN